MTQPATSATRVDFYADCAPQYGQRVEFFNQATDTQADVGTWYGERTPDGLLKIRLGMPWAIWKTATHWRPTLRSFAQLER